VRFSWANSANAVRWQVWNGICCSNVLSGFLCVISSWNHSFTRHLHAAARSTLEKKIDLWDLLLDFWGQQVDPFSDILATPAECLFSLDSPSKSYGTAHRDQNEKNSPS